MFLFLRIGIYQFLPLVKKKMQVFPRLLLFQRVLVELVRWPKGHPVGLDDQLVEGRMAPRNEAEIHLYKLIDNHLS